MSFVPSCNTTMYIYAEKITPRLSYIAEIIFGDVRFTSSLEAFYRYDGPKINYAHKKFCDKAFHFQPSGLLFEKGFAVIRPECFEWEGLKVFFRTEGDIPFDIFAAAFFLLSRYEEYLPHKKDSYGRFAHEESLAFKENFLHLPLVNLWVKQLTALLQSKFPGYNARLNEFTYIPTYDIDIAFAYRGKHWLRKLLAIVQRKTTMLNGKDVFDVYDDLDLLHDQYRLSPVYFFLAAKKRGRYDKNIATQSAAFKQLVKQTAGHYAIGLHPSWQSFYDEDLLLQEKNVLQKISGKRVVCSRQHYIKFTLPHTFQHLREAGITEDYSMGYGSINGFRASYTLPFYWYNLFSEEKTDLLLHPFCFMDANSFFEQKYSVQQAAVELQHYHDIVQQVSGQLITIFHNHFLTGEKQWQPWRKMYETFLLTSSGSSLTSLSLQQQ